MSSTIVLTSEDLTNLVSTAVKESVAAVSGMIKEIAGSFGSPQKSKEDEIPELMTRTQFMERFKVRSTDMFSHLMKIKAIPCHKVGRRIFIDRAKLQVAIEDGSLNAAIEEYSRLRSKKMSNPNLFN